MQRPVVRWIQLLEAVQGHHRLFADDFLGMGEQVDNGGEHGVDQVGVDELAHGKERSAH